MSGREVLARGDLDGALREAENRGFDDPEAARVAAIVNGCHGQWGLAAGLADRAGDRLLATLARALSGIEDPFETPDPGGATVAAGVARLVDAVRDLGSGGDPIPAALDAGALLEGRADALLPESPHVAAALWAGELLELGSQADRAARGGIERGPGGALLASRHRLALAWVQLLGDAWEGALAERQAAGDLVSRRDLLLGSAVEVGLALRAGELDSLTSRFETALSVLDRCGPDAVTIVAVGEIVAAGIRLGRTADVHRAQASADRLLDALARPPLLVWALAWRTARSAGMAGDATAARDAAKAMEDSGPPAPGCDCLLQAAHVWTEIAEARIEPEAVTSAARRLEDAGLRWEACALFGAAGVRATDQAVARSMLSRAREIRRTLPDIQLGGVGAGARLLTFREQEVAAVVLDGLSHKEIGARLHLSPKTVEHHVARIRQKLGASTRAEMLAGLRALQIPA